MASTKKVKYSSMEAKLLGLLPKRGRSISSSDLAEVYYNGRAPHNARGSVRSVMESLIRKIDDNKEPFAILKTDRSGPYPVEYRRVER